jgi:predicted alpha/beta-hydrolase family hydrolase
MDVPDGAPGVVVFAHGSGSSRHSPRNQSVASALRTRGLGTLLFDLLTPSEEQIDLRTRELRFDIELLAGRLASVGVWVSRETELPRGYFGASTGAAAALIAAAREPVGVGAVVSRGGRPDLARPWLAGVQAPTLLIVGGRDPQVLELNREALAQLRCPKELEIVEGASHLFEEAGTLERVADLAGDWFVRWVAAPIT